ncbi:MAG: TIGR03086 family protein [Pseudonocardiaceae bacterium]|nr:TIGR03086 family protein [Pseudonocardiaceae bacterium]
MEIMESYRRAQDGFDAMLAAVPQDSWDAPSACAEWTLRDVAGHVIWGQEQLLHWATGEEYTVTTGAPGTPHPGEMAGSDPLKTWRVARANALETINEESLGRTVSTKPFGDVPLAAMITLLVTDHLAHTWDVGHALGYQVRLDPELIPDSYAWSRTHITRGPGLFDAELTPPPGSDGQTRLLAFLGRAPWQPVSR